MRRKAPALLFAAAMAAAVAVSAAFLRSGVETDLLSLVGGDGVVSELNAKSAGVVRVLCADAERAAKCRAAFHFDEPFDPAAFMETVRAHGRGLLAAKARALLEKGDVERVRRSVRRRDCMGVGLFPKADDPNYFLSDFVSALASLRPEALADGAQILVGETRGGADEAEGLRRLLALAEGDGGIWLSGAPFHTLVATDSTKMEINILGGVSLAAVFALGWLLFRGFRFAAPVALALACGFAAGTGAVCLLPGRPHALTFLFGTTLVGLGVDYCYHALAERHDADFVRSLFRALLTTCLAFSPLAFSGVSVLRQMSVFTIAGLVAIYGFVMLFAGEGGRGKGEEGRGALLKPKHPKTQTPKHPNTQTLKHFMALSALVLALLGLSRGVRFSDDPALFHRPASVMARGEAKFAEAAGDAAGRVALVPLLRWQEANAALKEKVEEPRGGFLAADDLPSWLTARLDGEDFLVLPEGAAKEIVGEGVQGVRTVDVRGELRAVFAAMARETYRLLAISLAVLLVVSVALFRRHFLSHVLPVACAVAATFAALAALGEPITFFHALCFFVLVGLGMDYVIFSNADSNTQTPKHSNTSPVVFYSFLTSLVGFGMLAFTSFPVTRSMGVTLAVGLFFSYSFSVIARGRPTRGASGDIF